MPSAWAMSSAVRTSLAIRRSGKPSAKVSEMMNCLSFSSVVLFLSDEALRMSAISVGSSPNLRADQQRLDSSDQAGRREAVVERLHGGPAASILLPVVGGGPKAM